MNTYTCFQFLVATQGFKMSARNKELQEEVGQITLIDYVVKLIPTICTDPAIV